MNTQYHELRKTARWGNYGKDGKQPLEFKAIADMSDDHIIAVLKTQPQMNHVLRCIMFEEIQGRLAGFYPSIKD